MNIQYFLNKLINKENLSKKQSKVLLDLLTGDKIQNAQIGAILSLLRAKGETVGEISGFIEGMREKMTKLNLSSVIDVCGTGGDKSNSFNISTAVGFVVAGADVNVAKHGNRAASSKCGSADVLEELGVNIQLSSSQAENILKKTGMVFLFAPLFHKSFKNVSIVRKELGVKTIFNFLGPFVSPAGVKRQLIGVSDIIMAEKLAKVVVNLNYEHVMIVVGKDGFDEISLDGKTTVFDIKNKKIKRYFLNPSDFGFKKTKKEALIGDSKEKNAKIIKEILSGKKGACLDVVLLNSAVAFYVAGKAKDIKSGIGLARESIEEGKAKKVLENLVKETQSYAN